MAASDDLTVKLKRAVRKAERATATGIEIGGTGFTVLKLRASPVASLADRDRIAADELRAADEIGRVFATVSGALMFQPQSFEHLIPGYDGHPPGWLLDSWRNYKRFANRWSALASWHPMLAVVIAAVVDEVPFHVIEKQKQMRHGKAETVLIAGLRDYAARSGWVSGHLAQCWQTAALELFRPRLRQGASAGKPEGGLKSRGKRA